MDAHPGREAQMMARWVVSGSVANLVGPLFLAGLLTLTLTWREAFVSLAGLGLLLTVWTARQAFPAAASITDEAHIAEPVRLAVWHELQGLVRGLGTAITNPGLLRWVMLLELADLMGDVLTSYLALYFTDVVGTSQTQTSLLLSLFMGAGLISDLVVVWLLERFPGRSVVRHLGGCHRGNLPGLAAGHRCAHEDHPDGRHPTAGIGLVYRADGRGVCRCGRAQGHLPGDQSSLGGMLSSLIPWLVGWTAAQAGLQNAMWLLLLGPLSVLLLLPRKTPAG
jgi:MFS transporter, FSR family, fosmidomycin resistance protein